MKEGDIDITGLNKAEVLCALFNHSKQQGLGFLDTKGRESLTIEDAAKALAECAQFDYFRGRVLKVDLGGDSFWPALYDRDNGQGSAAAAIAQLRPQNVESTT